MMGCYTQVMHPNSSNITREKSESKYDGRYYDILNELKHEDGGLDYLINRNENGNEMIIQPNINE